MAKEKKKLDVSAVIADRGGNPAVETCPQRIVACRGDKVTWAITNRCSQDVTVMLAEFGDEPLEKKDLERSVKVGAGQTKQVTDTVKAAAPFQLYHYEIYLDGKPALDPEIVIKDSPDVEP